MNRYQALLVGLCFSAVISHANANAQDEASPSEERVQAYNAVIIEASELAQQNAKLAANTAEQKDLQTKIHQLLTRAFDLRQQINRQEVKEARAAIELAEKRISDLDRSRDVIIRRKHEDLLAGKTLQWPVGAINLAKRNPSRNRIQPGDTVAIYLESVLPFNPPKQGYLPPPITKLQSGAVVTGYPLVVTPDGTLQLPYLAPINIAGLTIREAETKIAKAYVDKQILRAGRAFPMLTLVPKTKFAD